MEEKRGNIILGIILAILMIIAIVIVIINPNKIQKTTKITQDIHEENITNKEENDKQQINNNEEKEASMHVGGTFCKMENQIVFYQEENKSIFLYNLNDNKVNKIAKLENGVNKIYFDGENIYFIPYYYNGKGIYKVDLEGNITKISESSSLQLWLTDDKIYFVKQIGYDDYNQNPQGNICVMDKDGNNVTELVRNIKNEFFIQGTNIYYTTQDRKMYASNIDGSNKEELAQGRKFVIATFEDYIIYIDYANQEEEHILNLKTKEDSIVGNYGIIKNYQGKTYLNVRKRLDDGSIEKNYTLIKIQEDGSLEEIGQFEDFETDLKYIINRKSYLYNQKEGTYIVKLDDGKKENTESYNNCKYFLGGYGYIINNTNEDDIKVERIEL